MRPAVSDPAEPAVGAWLFLRGGGRFRLRAVDDPVLTIQPLVENAILHGAGEDEHPLHVKVSAAAEDGKLVISVSDNGAGIPEEVLEKLRDHQAGGSGVQNVTERLKLFSGRRRRWTYRAHWAAVPGSF